MAYVSEFRLMEEIERHQHSKDSRELSFIYACFVCGFLKACFFPDGDRIGDIEMVDVLPAGGSMMLAGEIERVFYRCGDELEERLTCLAQITTGVGYFLTWGWKRINALGSDARKEGKGIFREREGWERVLLEMVMHGCRKVFDLVC